MKHFQKIRVLCLEISFQHGECVCTCTCSKWKKQLYYQNSGQMDWWSLWLLYTVINKYQWTFLILNMHFSHVVFTWSAWKHHKPGYIIEIYELTDTCKHMYVYGIIQMSYNIYYKWKTYFIKVLKRSVHCQPVLLLSPTKVCPCQVFILFQKRHKCGSLWFLDFHSTASCHR